MRGDFLTVVSGLPRSGTSLMMQMLTAGGVPPLTDNLRPADESNPRGYFEFEPVKRLRTDQSWLEQARGHAVKIIHLLMRELPADGTFKYRVLLMKRPIEEILASQQTMLEQQGKKSRSDETLGQTFENQLVELESYLAAHPAFSCLSVDYHRILKEPLRCAEEIDAFLGGGLDVTAMTRAVDPTLYRQRASGTRQ